jgi:hypothetical protein
VALSVVGTERLQASGYFRAKVDLHQPVEAAGCIRAILYLLQGPGEHVVQNVAAEAGEAICDGPMIFED